MRLKWRSVLNLQSLLFLLTLLLSIKLTLSLQFVDVSDNINLGLVYGNFSVVAVADQNGDKRNDLFLVTGSEGMHIM